MSGGVDSSVAAALLKKQGYDVSGMFMRLWFDHTIDPKSQNRCCPREAEELARHVAEQLDIPFRIVNARIPFKKAVVDYFLKELRSGRTPNPCVPCNKLIRFDYLLKQAKARGAGFLATGHYVQLKRDKKGITVHCGSDPSKDQSYFLYNLTQSKLKHVLFPLGDIKKAQVRKIARKLNIASADQPESQDICFIPRGKYFEFLSKYLKLKTGLIVSENGKDLGQHKGLPLYTIGQREGLGIGGSGPFYVARKDSKKNRLIVSRKGSKELLVKKFRVKNINFISGKSPKMPFKCQIQIRYRQKAIQATLCRSGKNIIVNLLKPERAITPGQSAVFYNKKKLIGGGVINNFTIHN